MFLETQITSEAVYFSIAHNHRKEDLDFRTVRAEQLQAIHSMLLDALRILLLSQKPGCCEGFFGPDCTPCPGGYTNPCYGRGNVSMKDPAVLQ